MELWLWMLVLVSSEQYCSDWWETYDFWVDDGSPEMEAMHFAGERSFAADRVLGFRAVHS